MVLLWPPVAPDVPLFTISHYLLWLCCFPIRYAQDTLKPSLSIIWALICIMGNHMHGYES